MFNFYYSGKEIPENGVKLACTYQSFRCVKRNTMGVMASAIVMLEGKKYL